MSSYALAGALSLLGAIACTAPTAPPAKPTAAAEEDQDPKGAIARWGGETVTAADLDEAVRKVLRRAEHEYRERAYETRKAALDGLIAKRLVEAKAKAAGKTPEQLVESEVLAKLPEPSPEEVKDLYERAKASGRPVPPLEQARPDIVRFLKQQKAQEADLATLTKALDEFLSKYSIATPAQPSKAETSGKPIPPKKADNSDHGKSINLNFPPLDANLVREFTNALSASKIDEMTNLISLIEQNSQTKELVEEIFKSLQQR